MTRPAKRPSQVLAGQLAEVRERRRWSQLELAQRLAKNGIPMDRSMIAKIENATRRITLDEAIALAAVLGISPVQLFIPTQGDADLLVTPQLAVSPRLARMWVRGQQPLDRSDAKTFHTEISDEEWTAMQHPGIRHLHELVQQFIDAMVAEDGGHAVDAIDAINDELARQRRTTERFGDREQ